MNYASWLALRRDLNMRLLRILTAGAALGLVLVLPPAAQAVLSDRVVVTLGPPGFPDFTPPVDFTFTFDESVEEPVLLPLLGIPLLPTLPAHLIVLDEPCDGHSDVLLLHTNPNSVFCVTQLC